MGKTMIIYVLCSEPTPKVMHTFAIVFGMGSCSGLPSNSMFIICASEPWKHLVKYSYTSWKRRICGSQTWEQTCSKDLGTKLFWRQNPLQNWIQLIIAALIYWLVPLESTCTQEFSWFTLKKRYFDADHLLSEWGIPGRKPGQLPDCLPSSMGLVSRAAPEARRGGSWACGCLFLCWALLV